MSDVLNMANWEFAKTDGPVEFRCFGNPDTAVGIKFFWYRDDPALAAQVEYHDENDPFVIDKGGACNQLRFILIGKPLFTAAALDAWIEARQGATIKQTFAYPYTLASGETRYRVDDGVTVVFK
jgi:hypothetical protein